MIRSKICPNSFGHTQGQKEIEKWEYCPCCGEKLLTRVCPQCGSELDIDWVYCTKCGKGDDARIQKKMMGSLEGKKVLSNNYIDIVDSMKESILNEMESSINK